MYVARHLLGITGRYLCTLTPEIAQKSPRRHTHIIRLGNDRIHPQHDHRIVALSIAVTCINWHFAGIVGTSCWCQ